MQLVGYVIEQGALSWCGSGDEDQLEGLAERHFEEFDELERRRALPAGSAEGTLRTWVMAGRGVGPLALAVLDVVLARAPRNRLEDNAWSPVRASTFDDLDAALKQHGLPRNASLSKLLAAPLGGGGDALSLDDGLLWLLPGQRFHAAENTWPAVIGRLEGDDSARAKALLVWWAQTKARHVDAALHGQTRHFDVLLVLA
jgi:hypothetical protein